MHSTFLNLSAVFNSLQILIPDLHLPTFSCVSAYASPNNSKGEGYKGGKDDKQNGGNNQIVSSATTPIDSNGFLKISPSQGKKHYTLGFCHSRDLYEIDKQSDRIIKNRSK